MTDRLGYISNISKGLIGLLGLHPAFFTYTVSSFQTMVRLDRIATNAPLDGTEEMLDHISSGASYILTFDTTNLLQKVEAEVLTHEELEMIRPNFQRLDFLTKILKVALTPDDYCYIYVM